MLLLLTFNWHWSDFTKTTELKAGIIDHKNDDDVEGECISMTMLDTTTNLVTNMESINEADLQEGLLMTCVRNGIYAGRILTTLSARMDNTAK